MIQGRFRSVRVPRTERRGIFPGRCAGLQVSPAGMNTVPRFALDSERSSDPPGIVGGDSRLLRVSSGADSSSSSCPSFTCTCFIRNVRIFPCPVRIRRARIPSRQGVSSGPCRGCPGRLFFEFRFEYLGVDHGPAQIEIRGYSGRRLLFRPVRDARAVVRTDRTLHDRCRGRAPCRRKSEDRLRGGLYGRNPSLFRDLPPLGTLVLPLPR